MHLRGLVAVLTLLGTAAAADAAEAVALAAVDLVGAPPPVRAQLRASLIGGLEAGGVRLVPEPEVEAAYQSQKGLRGCHTNTCLRHLGQVLGVPHVVRARIEVVGHTHYAVTLEMVGTGDGQVEAKGEDRCQVCTVAEANESVSNAARQLVVRAFAQPEPEAPAPTPAVTTTAPATAVPAAQAVKGPAAPAKKRPLLARWELWTGVGLGAAVIIAVGVGVGVSQASGPDHWAAAQSGCTPPCWLVDYGR